MDPKIIVKSIISLLAALSMLGATWLWMLNSAPLMLLGAVVFAMVALICFAEPPKNKR
jgi:hypothetical protein